MSQYKNWNPVETLVENIVAYTIVFLLIGIVVWLYLRKNARISHETIKKIEKAKEFGLHEPVSLHPVVNPNSCIGSGACIEACPEKDILGIVNGKATPINTSRCVGHGACYQACPMNAIALYIGTEKRGVDIPHLDKDFETNIPMIYIVGELGGMGLIKNAVEQGKQAVNTLSKKLNPAVQAQYDIAIIGAGPAGIGATLTAAQNKLSYITLEQDTLGGTVYSFPRQKIVMTHPMDLPLFGKIKLTQTSKTELLQIWKEVISKNNININEQEKVEKLSSSDNIFSLTTTKGTYTARSVVIAIGRRGTPRKLGVKGEDKEKVFYRLLDPELIQKQNILVVGGGDSAIESALLLADENNQVTISYRSESFSRIKPMNLEKINDAAKNDKVKILFNTTVQEIFDDSVLLNFNNGESAKIANELVYVLAGGELPTAFLKSVGIEINRKFGEKLRG
ncbi:MAG: NAD(P)-binding domain-containing protein [Ignavibacteriales bacterium]|nr:NAD(P)-binding domain-containing protein [Ignavibacteriales bacterium]